MIEMFSSNSFDGDAIARCLIDLAWKAAVLCLAAWCVDLALGRRRPLARSSLWHATLVAMAMLPLATLVLPGFSAPLGQLPLLTRRASPPPIAPRSEPVRPIALDTEVASGGVGDWGLGVGEGPQNAPQARVHEISGLAPEVETGEASAREQSPRAPWTVLAMWCGIAVYFAGCLALTIRFAVSLRAVSALLAMAEPLGDDGWRYLLAHWRRQLGVTRSVRLLASPETSVPLQVGWVRPVILLPHRVMDADDEGTRVAVLVHELGHVRRGDYAWNLLLRILTVVYWPHPLIWLAGRRIAQVREQACDELCIHWLGGASNYRARLIDLAAGLVLRRSIAALGMAMSQPTRLARRLQSIEMSRGRPHCLSSAIARRSTIGVMVAIACLLAAATTARPVARAQDSGDATVRQQPPAKEAAHETEQAREASPDEPASEPAETAPPPAPDEEGQASDPEPLKVYAARVRRGDFTVEISQICTLEAGRTSAVYARVPGFIRQMNVEVGDHVKRGQVLAELESLELTPQLAQAESLLAEAKAEQRKAIAAAAEIEANLAVAQADLEKAEADLEGAAAKLTHREKRHARIIELAQERAVDGALVDEEEEKLAAARSELKAAKSSVGSSKAQIRQRAAAVDSAEAAKEFAAARLRVAEAKLAEAKLRGEAVHIVSPMDGVILECDAQVGDSVGAPGKNAPICTVADLGRMSAVVHMPDHEAVKVKQGDAARIRLDAFPGKFFKASVRRVALKSALGTKTVRVDLDLEPHEPNVRLLPGLSGVAAVAVETHRGALSVPDLFRLQSGVLTIVDGRAIPKPVEWGATSLDRREILAGLSEGDLVITGLADPKKGYLLEAKNISKHAYFNKRPRVEIVDPPASD